MKFRSSLQALRPESKEESARPPTTTYFRMPRGRAANDDIVEGQKPSPKGGDAKGTPSKAMQDFLSRTGAGLRATGANLKARGAKLERRIPRKKAKVKPPSKRNSQIQVRTFDLDEKALDRMTRPTKERKASEAFLEKQRTRAGTRSKQNFNGVSPLSSQSQADLDKRPLSPLELEAMFLGAPYFSVRKIGSGYKPEVQFRGGDVKASLHFPADYEGFGHSTFKASTLSRTRRQEVAERPASSHSTEPVKMGGALAEVPSMLTANGLDVGAVGFEHFLQTPLGDDVVAEDEESLVEKREQLLAAPEELGLRELNVEHMIDRLTEMGEELFERLLSAERGSTAAAEGSVTLKTQIEELQKVLNTKGLWHDFSRVEWRTRVGQLLWAADDFAQDWSDGSLLPSERDMLLLQITLAAELMMRLLALEALSSSFPPLVTQEDAELLESQRTAKVKWDLVLAERFLDNISVSAKVPHASEGDKKANRGSFFSAITFFSAKEESLVDEEQSMQPVFSAKHETEQLDGLAYFADRIHWPHANDVKTELESKLSRSTKERPVSTAASLYATPLSSPKFPTTPGTNRNSFFGFPERNVRPGFSRKGTAQSISLWPARNIAGNVESFEVGGWLSRSWLSGLLLPGEAARHYLISALLENSPQAITALGEEANLYGGFVYEGLGFWSKTSVVGRVLAARPGAVDCMGWVSVPGLDEHEDGWIASDVRDVPGRPDKARIENTEAIAKASDPLVGHKVEKLQAGDFSRPSDGPLVMGNEVRFERLICETTSLSETTDAEETSIASLTFSSPVNPKLSQLHVPLTYDVQFVSSYPCHPQTTRPRTLSRPMTPSPQLSFEEGNGFRTPVSKTSGSDSLRGRTLLQDSNPTKTHRPSNPSSSSTTSFHHIEKELPSLPAHPLHIDYQFTTIPVATLLSMPVAQRPRALSEPTQRKLSIVTTADGGGEEVVVLDCRGSQDLELLARAWCAKVGENAIVGKSGRSCLACCIREARALAIGVVIRV